MIEGPAGPAEPTHWSFGQIASLIGVPGLEHEAGRVMQLAA